MGFERTSESCCNLSEGCKITTIVIAKGSVFYAHCLAFNNFLYMTYFLFYH